MGSERRLAKQLLTDDPMDVHMVVMVFIHGILKKEPSYSKYTRRYSEFVYKLLFCDSWIWKFCHRVCIVIKGSFKGKLLQSIHSIHLLCLVQNQNIERMNSII